MPKLIEMDENVTLKDQMENQVTGPVILIMRPSSKINQDLFLHNYTKDLEKAMFLSITQSGNP